MSAIVVLLWRPAGHHVRAMEVLKRFSESSVATPPAEVVEEAATFASAEGPARARFYLPKDQPRAPVVVLVHGVHYKGIEEPRLVRFARSIASSGIAVMTPEVSALADYRVDPRSIDTVGASIRFAKERARGRRVGVMGFSFGGGLSLLAAADPRFSDDVAFVVGVGAHDDLARVTRFFAGEKIVDPDGRPQKLRAHDYGAMVFVYGHVDRFFPRDDAETARAAIRAWLHDERDAARATATKLSPASRERIEQLFQAKVEAIRPELLRAIDDLAPQMDRVSPHGHLGGLRAPVYLLHGSGDTVIPASETMWLARDVGPERLRDALVSPAVVHVELEGEPGWQEKWRVLHFMAGVLGEAEAVGG